MVLYTPCVLQSIVITFAEQNFQKGSQKADEYIRIIKDKLEIAVSQCIEAAGHEIDPAKQKPLLRVCIIIYFCIFFLYKSRTNKLAFLSNREKVSELFALWCIVIETYITNRI